MSESNPPAAPRANDAVASERAIDPVAIDLVSPLPPVRSGIADYCADLLDALARRCDLRLVRLPGQEVAPEIAERYPLVGPEAVGEAGRVPLYQMGNNHHHIEVWKLAMEHPGVLTLHDLVLHHFLIDRTVKDGDYQGYQRQLVEDHGWMGAAAALPMAWPGGSGMAAQFALPAHRGLLARQRGVLVHSRWAEGMLAEEVPGLRVRALAMGIPLPPEADDGAGRAFRRRHGIPEEAPMLGSFGFQTPIKRTEVVIRALASDELAGVHLMVAGEMAPILRLDELAEELGVGERVHCLGFLPFDQLAPAIAACDLCLNLRYPTAGETSASLLRILAVGRPAVVSEHAQSAELPDAGVVKVPIGEGEELVLRRRLRELLDDPSALEALGAGARRHVAEHHRVDDAARAVVAACAAWGRLEPTSLATFDRQPPPPTTLTWSHLPGALEVILEREGEDSDEPTTWCEGERRTLEVRLQNHGPARWLAAERGPGGVGVEVRLEGRPRSEQWVPLPHDLEAGKGWSFRRVLRRPRGPARLVVRPHVLGRQGIDQLGGPAWEGDV